MNIEDIKNKIGNAAYWGDISPNKIDKDIEYLLSIIERAEKALTYYADEPYLGSIGYSDQAIEALKAIRGN